MNNETVKCIYRLLRVSGIGTVQANRILASLPVKFSRQEFFERIRTCLTDRQWNEFLHNETVLEPTITHQTVHFIASAEPEYPVLLRNTLSDHSPVVLSYLGNPQLFNGLKVGYCGSRNVSLKGLDITIDCTEQLCEQEITVVSGYAKGVDVQAHKTALQNGGATVIILAEGIRHFRIKGELKSCWDWDRVLVVSEFLPDDPWTAYRAMQRNNTIIGLSNAMFIIEAREKGGSFNAGQRSLQLKKELYVPQYLEYPETAKGNPLLLGEGARAIRKDAVTQRANLSELFAYLKSSGD